MEVKVGQSLLDIALQTTGDADNALQIALFNGLCLTESLISGTTLEIPSDLNTNVDVLEVYREKKIIPATAATSQQEALNPFGGIEYMGIEIDFIVS